MMYRSKKQNGIKTFKLKDIMQMYSISKMTIYNLNKDDARTYVFRRRGEILKDKYVREVVNKSKDCNVQFWGAIAFNYKRPLVRYEGRLTGERYRDEILELSLPEIIEELGDDE